MAIEAKIQLSANRDFDDTYIKVNTPRSFVEGNVLKLAYDIEYYTEVDGKLLKTETKSLNYQSGDIWAEAYADLKKNYLTYKDV